jgi:probable F420-dependent oxidoreductase
MHTDYDASGIAFDPPSVRIDRLAESLEIMTELWSTGTATFAGRHYNVAGAVGFPAPCAQPHPTLVIGGGSRRILTLAAQRADVVSFVPSLAAGKIGPEMAAGALSEKFAERVAWVREAAGPRFSDLELQCWTVAVQVVPNAAELVSQMAPAFGMSPEQLADSPLALIGTTEAIIDTLVERRERFGFSYVVVHEAELEAFGPVVAKLAGG